MDTNNYWVRASTNDRAKMKKDNNGSGEQGIGERIGNGTEEAVGSPQNLSLALHLINWRLPELQKSNLFHVRFLK